jgi:hypothetical protein
MVKFRLVQANAILDENPRLGNMSCPGRVFEPYRPVGVQKIPDSKRVPYAWRKRF